ncbi:hypothetical protein [Pseudomonas sp. MPC6]|uniref:hypothetical protein n=1 Tax=unclassified Pseudomonas TaxID=196821 RepID=UPI0013758901|nr:hypothetical protein [Pseudomonas sp. MPC6]
MNDESDHTDYRSRDYPVREDMVHQVKVWRFERWGWYVIRSSSPSWSATARSR